MSNKQPIDKLSAGGEPPVENSGPARQVVLLLESDMDCYFAMNEDDQDSLSKNSPRQFVLSVGSHLIQVATQDGLIEKEWV